MKQRSPWRNAGGKFNRFKKIVDGEAIKRSVFSVKRNYSLKKCTPRKKGSKRLINKSRSNTQIAVKRKIEDIINLNTLEDGEIHIDDVGILLTNDSKTTMYSKDNEGDEDDDCVVIEPDVDEITIEDDNDDDLPSSSKLSSGYQSLVHSFKERVLTTPCKQNKSNASVKKNSKNFDDKIANKTSHFFVDTCGHRAEMRFTNFVDTLIDYSKLSTIGDESTFKHHKESCDFEIIHLNDSECNESSSPLKEKSIENEDDSVIFVSEMNKNDFIPIVDKDIPPNKILKISERHNTPENRQRTTNNSLFTQSETKKLNEYNENAYNPSGDVTLMPKKRMVIIDGSNVAFKHGLDQLFSVKGLKISIEYFEKMGHEVKAVIPQFRMNKSKSSDPEELERLHKAGKIVQTPCKNLPGLTSSSYDDRFILQLAYELDAAIVSNDNYRDLLHENPAFKKIIENRVLGYTWCNDIFILPKDPYGKWGPSLHEILNR